MKTLLKWEKPYDSSNTERTTCGRGHVRQTRFTSGMAPRWSATVDGKFIATGVTTKRKAKRCAEQAINARPRVTCPGETGGNHG